jgi:hypothetical protein
VVVGIALQKIGQPLLFIVNLILRVVKAEVVGTFNHLKQSVKAATDLRSKPGFNTRVFNWASNSTLHQWEHRRIDEGFRIEANVVAARNSGSRHLSKRGTMELR